MKRQDVDSLDVFQAGGEARDAGNIIGIQESLRPLRRAREKRLSPS
jgi:hypothetical protein